MSSFVNICCKLETNSSNKLNKLVINDLKIKVKTLSELVSKQLDLTEDKFDLMCFGRIMSSDQNLECYNIRNGTTVFVLNKVQYLLDNTNGEQKTSKAKVCPNQSDIQHMVIALRTALMDSSFRQMLDKLSEYEFRENLMAVTPGLREDPTSFAILQDPDLLTTLTEPTNIHKVLARHPCLLDAATNLSATFHEEIIANESTSGPSSAGLLNRGSSAFSYSLDAMSDDEDMDDAEEGTEANAGANPTAQRIAELMVRAYQSNRTQGTGGQTSRSGVITQDMLTQALRQSSTPSTPVSAPVTTAPASQPSTSASSTAARIRSFSTQLQQMRDLGITDDIVAIQALEATNGDIQAAIDIIFSDNN